jgi:hypothetical protein
VQVTLKTGATFNAMSGKVKGDYGFPLTDGELENKFVWMSSNRLDPGQARAAMDAIWSLETRANMSGFVEMLQTMC